VHLLGPNAVHFHVTSKKKDIFTLTAVTSSNPTAYVLQVRITKFLDLGHKERKTETTYQRAM
jgi:hypothetical protein